MRSKPLSLLAALLCLLAPLAPRASAQTVGTLASVAGQVVDLTLDSSGRLLYCTQESSVGRIDPATGVVTVLATAASGGFPQPLRGVVETPAGDVSVVDFKGDIYRLPGGNPPAIKVYSNLFIIKEPSDLVVDATGNYVTAAKTPSSFTRALQWVSPDGVDWAYYLVKNQPVALAVDPLSGDFVTSDTLFGGRLVTVDTGDDAHPTSVLDGATPYGFNEDSGSGDLAFDKSGNAFVISGGTLRRFDRALGSASVVQSGFQTLRGVALAGSSGAVPSATGFSVYLAEGGGPTSIRELGGALAPAARIAPPLGIVPSRGKQVAFFGPIKVYELSVDLDGNLLVGGDFFGTKPSIRRLELPSLKMTIVADNTHGISGKVEGISVGSDGTLYALTREGAIQRVTENPTSVTTLYSNPSGLITAGKDLVRDRQGNFYVADRACFGCGTVVKVTPNGTASVLTPTKETRGLTADPFTGKLFVSEWNGSGFLGSVGRLDPQSGAIAPIPGFVSMNYTNDFVWGDGDTVQDVLGNVYNCAEDDFSLYRFETTSGRLVRMGSTYLNHPSGVAIARSLNPAESATGFSLYVSEFDFLWELPGVPAPAPVLADLGAPTIGRIVGSVPPALGAPRDMIADPAGLGFLVATSQGHVVRVARDSGAATSVALVANGLELAALARTSSGRVLVATRGGLIVELDPAAGFAPTLVFTNPLGALTDVRGLAVDGQNRPLVVDGGTSSPAGRLFRIESGQAQLVGATARGVRAAIDPLTGDLFVTERGKSGDGGGEILRVDLSTSPAAAGHFRGKAFTLFAVGAGDGGIAFDAAGSFYIAAGDSGRIVRVERTSGARSDVSGQYDRPRALALAPGRPGSAGLQGTSLFVLDGASVWEVGVAGLPSPPPPASPPGLAPRADLAVTGLAVLGATAPVRIESAPDAGRIYLIIPTVSGKVPGLPLSAFGAPLDPRVLPINLDLVFGYINNPSVTPGFLGVLDGNGRSAAGTGIFLPNIPSLLGLERFLDLAWVAIDPSAQSAIATVGGTAQLFLGN